MHGARPHVGAAIPPHLSLIGRKNLQKLRAHRARSLVLPHRRKRRPDRLRRLRDESRNRLRHSGVLRSPPWQPKEESAWISCEGSGSVADEALCKVMTWRQCATVGTKSDERLLPSVQRLR